LLDIDVEFIRHPRARRYVLRVRPDGSVRVTLPRWGSRRQAESFAAGQHHWIEKQRARMVKLRAAVPAPDAAEVRRLRELASTELPGQLRQLAARHGLSVAKISIRNQRSRWGSCSPRGHICLNWRLIQMPAFVREYVLIHELMHLRRLDHSRKFWKLVAEACPDYRQARRWLLDHREALAG
jgi:predicted metal-dependent hydrolase